jgi:hypothetical protein
MGEAAVVSDGAAGSGRSMLRPAVLVLVLAGLAVRVWMLVTPFGGLDSDEAIVGLMARDVLDGDFPMFSGGQTHGGPHEPLLTAAFFAVFGASTVVMKIVALLLSAGACVLIWRLGRRTIGEPAATAAGLLFWVWPAAFLWWSVKSRGFYHVALLIGLGVLLLVLRLAERPSGRDMAALGALVGTGLWCTPQTVLFFAPALLWLALRRFSAVRLTAFAVAAGIPAAFPFWVHNLRNGWVTFDASPASFAMPAFGDRLEGIFQTGLPGALGLKFPDGSRWVAGPFGRAWYVALLVLFAAAVVKTLASRAGRREPIALVFLVVTAYPFLLALSPYSAYVDHPRYLYYLGPLCALLIARGLAALRGPALAGGLVAAVTLSGVAIVTMDREREFRPSSEGVAIPEDLDPLVDHLTTTEVDHVYADYWLAYYLAFETGERIVATPYRGLVRDVDAEASVRAHPHPGYLFVNGSPAEEAFHIEIDALEAPYERTDVGGFVVYAPEENLGPETFPEMRAASP